jgi:hypothetical protein
MKTRLETYLGQTVTLSTDSYGGAALSDWWDFTLDQPKDKAISLKAAAANVVGVIWNQGETDAQNDISTFEHKLRLMKIINYVREDNPECIWFIQQMSWGGAWTGGGFSGDQDTSRMNIMQAHQELVDEQPNVYMVCHGIYSQHIADNAHYEDAAHSTWAEHTALSIGRILRPDLTAYSGTGLKVSDARIDASGFAIIATIQHDGGDRLDLLDGTNPTDGSNFNSEGFVAHNGTSFVTPTNNVVKNSTNEVFVHFSSAVGVGWTLWYFANAGDGLTDSGGYWTKLVVDNTTEKIGISPIFGMTLTV